jgi:hypothetical protein
MHRLLNAAFIAALIGIMGCGATIATSPQGTTFTGTGFSASMAGDLVESAAYEQGTRATNSAALTSARVATSMVSDDERMTLTDTQRICNQLLVGSMNDFQRCVCDSARREAHQRQREQSGPVEILPGQYELVQEMAAVAAARGTYAPDGTVTYPVCSRDPVMLRQLAGLEARTAENERRLELLRKGLRAVEQGRK